MALMHRALIVTAIVVGLSAASLAQQTAADVTQWRGANRDGVVTGFTAPASWPAQLTQRWKIDIGTRVRDAARRGEQGVPVLASGRR